jgi:hypothetical protein
MKIRRLIWGFMAAIAVIRFVKEVIEIVNRNSDNNSNESGNQPSFTIQNENNKETTEETSWPGSKDKSISEVF